MTSEAEGFVVKDSGERVVFDSGMKRDVDTDKIKYHLITGGPMFRRWAVHLTNGAKKYDDDNWMKAEGIAELTRFRASAFRHFMQWWDGDRDEDHAAAVFFNINGAEYVRDRILTISEPKSEWNKPPVVLEPVVPALVESDE